MKRDEIPRYEMEIVGTDEPRVHDRIDEDGDWCSFGHVEAVVNVAHDERDRALARCKTLERENRLLQVGYLAANRLMAHDIRTLFDFVAVPPIESGSIGRLAAFAEQFRSD